MSKETEGILKANETFYRALGTRDLELMERVWMRGSRAKCIHPGWTVLQGWEAIRQSWENVFDPADQVDIKLHNVTCEIKGDVAWVTCIQHMTYVNRLPMGVNISLSTNIFEHQDAEWLMVVHHASPLPVVRIEKPEEGIQ